jgi:alpha-tubulin suppressor-like RCC1 family protein
MTQHQLQMHVLLTQQQQLLQLQQQLLQQTHTLQQQYALPDTARLGPIVSMACGDDSSHCIVVTQQNKVYGYGSCACGVLGLGNLTAYCTDWTEIQLPPDDSGEADVRCVAVACGPRHTLLLRSNGTLLGAGTRDQGRLGLATTEGCAWKFEKIPLGDRISAIACGREHSVALSRQGKLYVTGSNQWGQLGLEQTVLQYNAFVLSTAVYGPVSAIACGNYTTIVTTALGLWVAGLNVGRHSAYLFREEKSLAGFNFITDKLVGQDEASVRSPQQKRDRVEVAEKAAVAIERSDDAVARDASLLVSFSSPARQEEESPQPHAKRPRIMLKQKPV